MSNKHNVKKWMLAGITLVGLYYGMGDIAKKKAEPGELDKDNPYIKSAPKESKKQTVYEGKVKPAIDKGLSFVGLVVFAPVYGLISLVVYLDDPGPVFFTQKRVGKDGEYFLIHKFRTMKMDTPHDIPTHLLSDPEKYITRIGGILRKTSLDEIPQIWDIFRGKMSIIGPRPALWNQENLIAEREKWGANAVTPGLTGLAQIKGRDELEIADKAKLDGTYVSILRSGGWKAFKQDVNCFIGTIASVICRNGVVEGGTGKLKDEIEDFGFKKTFHIDPALHKRVLVTGAGSYIGESFKKYAAERYPNIEIHTIDMIDGSWKSHDFSGYDCVFHVAGIAHVNVGKITEEEGKRYYAINTELAIETARTAKQAGVSQFIFMSSMIVYGDSALTGAKKVIDEHTIPAPTNPYGDSKWQADKGVRELADDNFHVAVLRPPMIYGRGSKGNYPTLSRMARVLPFFPDIENQRSMLYIDNLCEFVCLLILSNEGGIFFPQNAEYTKTAEMVEDIGKAAHRQVRRIKLLNPLVSIAARMPGKIGSLALKAFGSCVYDQRISHYEGLDYQKISLKESVRCTEIDRKKPVLILVNHDVVIYNFRRELVERLLKDGYEVHISSPYGERIDDLISLGAIYHKINIDRHGMNVWKDIRILYNYQHLIKEIVPVAVLGYTIKPNIYGAAAARFAKVPFIANITGLGTAVECGGIKQQLALLLYKAAFVNVQRVFFQNEENMQFFQNAGIAVDKHALLPGSGVNLDQYLFTPLPECGDGKKDEPVRFAFISRIMKEKGIDLYLSAAERIKKEYPCTEFHVCGFCEDEYEGRLEELHAKGVVQYHGMIRDVAGFMREMHCIVHPTYYPEGLSNVLLEACACGRAIITTDRSGCREVVENEVNGYMVPQKDVRALINAMEKFMKLSAEQKKMMGIEARKLVERNFSRQIVVEKYMNEIKAATS